MRIALSPALNGSPRQVSRGAIFIYVIKSESEVYC